MKKLISLLYCLCLFALLKAQPDKFRDQILSVLSAEEEAGFSGSVLVVCKNEILINQGFGFTDKRRRHKVESNTIFNIASITKSFTAIGILQLVEQGRLRLEDQLASFFEELPADKKDITVHQLLTHSSGMPHGYVCMKVSERAKCMRAILKEKLVDKPGLSFRYSNHNYAVLAAIIEIVNGTSWEECITKCILQPAELRNTYFWGAFDDRNAAKVAQKTNRLGKETRQRNWDYLGSGGIYTTSEDLYRWFQAMQSENILSKKYQKLLFEPTLYSQSGKLGIGYGWFISQTESGILEYWTRGSESFGHNAVLRWFPEKETLIIVCANTGEKRGKRQTDNRRISDLIMNIIL